MRQVRTDVFIYFHNQIYADVPLREEVALR
jgi:hypothetical protein